MEFTNYYICGSSGSGKTWLINKWLERMEEKNEMDLKYPGFGGVIRMDYDWKLRRKLKGYKGKYIALYENFIPTRARGYRNMVPKLNMNGIFTVFLTVCPIEKSPENVKKMIEENKFRVIDMDQEKKVDETVEQTVNRIVSDMECPVFRFFEENEKKPKVPQTGDN